MTKTDRLRKTDYANVKGGNYNEINKKSYGIGNGVYNGSVPDRMRRRQGS